MRTRGLTVILLSLLLWPGSAHAADPLVRASLPGQCELRVPSRSDERPVCWHRTCPHAPVQALGCDLTAMHQVAGLMAAPDGAWLAVVSVGEGHPILEVVSLHPWFGGAPFKTSCELNPYPGTVIPERWRDGRLEISSDVDLKGPAESRIDGIGQERRYWLDPGSCALEVVGK